MKVITLKSGAFAANPQKVVSFNTDTVLEVGHLGLTEENLKRMVELKLAKFTSVLETVETKIKEVGTEIIDKIEGKSEEAPVSEPEKEPEVTETEASEKVALSDETIPAVLKDPDVELQEPEEVSEPTIEEIAPESIENTTLPEDTQASYPFESITDKNELVAHALDVHGIELSPSSSIKKMIATLKTAIEPQGE